MLLGAGMTQELHAPYTRGYGHKHLRASTSSQTLHSLMELLRSKARFGHLSRPARSFVGRPLTLRRSSHLTASSCHIVKRQNGACVACRVHLAGFVYR